MNKLGANMHCITTAEERFEQNTEEPLVERPKEGPSNVRMGDGS